MNVCFRVPSKKIIIRLLFIVCACLFFALGGFWNVFWYFLLQIKPQWQRTRAIMALVPPENAPSSDSSSSSEDEVIIQDPNPSNLDDDDVTYCSSEPRSYPSSLNDLDISDSDRNPTTHNAFLSDEETIPLSPVITEMFPTGRPQQQLPFLNSVSSVLSPSANSPVERTTATTRSKRKANIAPRIVTKKRKKYVRKPLKFKFKNAKFDHAAKVYRISATSAFFQRNPQISS